MSFLSQIYYRGLYFRGMYMTEQPKRKITCERCPCASHFASQLTWGKYDCPCPCHDHQHTEYDEYERY